MEDQRIVELYWSRDETAIRETDRKYGRYLLKVAYNILADTQDSEEGVNDTYLHAWNSMPPHKPGVLSSYLAKITRRVSIDMFRRKNREKRRASEYALSLTELEECISTGGGPEEAIGVQELAEAINTFLHRQSEEVRNVFIGRYYFLDPVKAVAQYCGMSESAAKSMLHRTRGKLRDYLREEGFDL